MQGLVDLGARRIAVSGVPLFGCWPNVITLYSSDPTNALVTRNCNETLNSVGSDYNAKVQEASFNPRRYKIQIGEGLYKEYIVVSKKKTNLMLVGAGMDKTIISGNRTTAIGPYKKTYQTATAGQLLKY